MASYNALTINDSFGVSPRSHFVTSDGRDLDLRYLMLKNLPEKLKAMGVLFGAGSDISINADGKIYYASGVSINDNDNPQVLVTKQYVDTIMTGSWEKAGAVAEHEKNTAHLIIAFQAVGNFGINYSPEECIAGYSGTDAAKKYAASLFHHHDGRYALIGHSHDYTALIKNTIEELLLAWGSIEVYPYTFVRRDSVGITKTTDPYTIYPDTEDATDDASTICSSSGKKGPPMDAVVNVSSLRKRLQPRFIRCKLAQRPYVEVAGEQVTYQKDIDNGDDAVHKEQTANYYWREVANLKDLLQYLHPGLKLSILDDDVKVYWGCTNYDKQAIADWLKNVPTDYQYLRYQHFLKESDYVHSSIVKFDYSNIAIPVIDFRRENIFDPVEFVSGQPKLKQDGTLDNKTSLTDTVNGYYFWLALPDNIFTNAEEKYYLKNIENSVDAIKPAGNWSDNWEATGFTLDSTYSLDGGSTEFRNSIYDTANLLDSRGLSKIFDENGNAYTIYLSTYKYSGSLYRYAFSRSQENTTYNDELEPNFNGKFNV